MSVLGVRTVAGVGGDLSMGRREQTVGNWWQTSFSSILRSREMWLIICSWASAILLLVGLSGGGEVTIYGVLPALSTEEEEWEGTKMGEDEQDMASDKRVSSCLKGQRW